MSRSQAEKIDGCCNGGEYWGSMVLDRFCYTTCGDLSRRKAKRMQDLHFEVGSCFYPLTVEQLDAAVQGKIHIYIGEDIYPLQLRRKDVVSYERAKTQHYALVEVGQQRLGEAYRQYCEATQTPWVCIQLHDYTPGQLDECLIDEEHATVWYDLFHLGQSVSPLALQHIEHCFGHARPGLYHDAGLDLSETGGYGVVAEYTAEKLAAALFTILTQPQNLKKACAVWPQSSLL